jgi:hypothetical protein
VGSRIGYVAVRLNVHPEGGNVIVIGLILVLLRTGAGRAAAGRRWY